MGLYGTNLARSTLFAVLCGSFYESVAFQPSPILQFTRNCDRLSYPQLFFSANNEDEDEDDEKPENPYADPNYPDLEFVNYDDPEYQVDQGDEFFDNSQLSTEEEIENMREDRRRRNDEFQFQTYYQDMLRDGEPYYGEWTVYRTSTFLNDPELELVDKNGMPRIKMLPETVHVVSTARKEVVETDSDMSVDGELILTASRLATLEEIRNPLIKSIELSPEAEEAVTGVRYAPEEIKAFDFRGSQGNMMVGNSYTTSFGIAKDDKFYEQYRTEVGLQYESMRFRLLLDYRVTGKDEDNNNLKLYSMVVGRETLEGFARTRKVETSKDQNVLDALFGTPGAPGGLYDPPPVGSEAQATKYMLLPMEGRASVLVPHTLYQDDTFDSGWVTTIDWTPGSQRFQVDRKIQAAPSLMELRTLELSEVQAADADDWRPTDGGENMRQ